MLKTFGPRRNQRCQRVVTPLFFQPLVVLVTGSTKCGRVHLTIIKMALLERMDFILSLFRGSFTQNVTTNGEELLERNKETPRRHLKSLIVTSSHQVITSLTLISLSSTKRTKPVTPLKLVAWTRIYGFGSTPIEVMSM